MLSLLVCLSFAAGAPDAPSRVQIEKISSGYRLVRNGKPYFVKGAGSQRQISELAAAGGNSIRTWGVGDDTPKLLDQAHQKGLTVTVGYWLMKSGDGGFSYLDKGRVEAQFEAIRDRVRQLKSHPALLIWAVGNEAELGLPKPEEEAYWRHVNALAAMIHREDPDHPVMTVVADMWPEKMVALKQWAPNLDLLGVNSYGGLPTLHERMKDWKKPYLVTEFQHASPTQPSEKTGLVEELSSSEKASECVRMYKLGIQNHPGRVLGSYVFHWDRSDSQLASLYAMHLKTGEKLQACDEMQKLWTGRYPRNRAPIIVRGWADSADSQTWRVEARDPEGDKLSYELQIIDEAPPRYVGDFEKELPVVHRETIGGTFTLPNGLKPSKYRAFVIVRDGRGGAAVWSLPFKRT